jgi:hypothetical protein
MESRRLSDQVLDMVAALIAAKPKPSELLVNAAFSSSD